MKLNLTVWQRVAIQGRVGQLKGSAGLMRLAFGVLDLMELSDGEKTRVGYVEGPQGSTWRDTKARFEIEIRDPGLRTVITREVEGFVRTLETQEEWELPIIREMDDLCEQLDVDMEEIVRSVVQEKERKAAARTEKEKKEIKGEGSTG